MIYDYLPPYYRVKALSELLDALEIALLKLLEDSRDLKKQLFIDTATWGLDLYERELGLKTDYSLSFEERRSIIKTKKQSVGTTTKAMIKHSAETFSGGEVEIIENSSDYSYIVKFIGVKGIPSNIDGFLDMLETISPCHLRYTMEYTYRTWLFITGITWNDIKPQTWGGVRTWGGGL